MSHPGHERTRAARRRVVALVCLAGLLSAASAGAQVPSPEVFLGGTGSVLNDADDNFLGGIGVSAEASFSAAASRIRLLLGVSGDVYDGEFTTTQVVGGVRYIRGSPQDSARPFVHLLFGTLATAHGAAMLLGGGMGLQVDRTDRLTLRPIQVDLVSLAGEDAWAIRFSTGLVVHLGGR